MTQVDLTLKTGNSPFAVGASSAAWHGPGARARRRSFSWHALVWALVFPARRHHIGVTVPGVFLIGLAMGIGTAAYNTASNILFITLSLLLACLLLSGLLSWFNFRGVSWRVRVPGPWRAGHETLVAVEIRNGKAWLPTYGLWFDVKAYPHVRDQEEADAKEQISEALAAAERAVAHGRVFLRERLGARSEAAVEWLHRPERRGEVWLELAAVGSLFPFGFLRKSVGAGVRLPVLVWPAQVDYQWHGPAAARTGAQGERTARAGVGEDLLAVRKYAQGDSHRLIHWKASARLGQLMVRQFAAESLDGFSLRVDADAELWTRPEQFEKLCGFVASLAEDLFAEGRLRSVAVANEVVETRGLRDVEAVLDLLAVVAPVKGARFAAGSGDPALQGSREREAGGQRMRGGRRNVITFAPEGTTQVAAYLDGALAATA